jgi:hypothetical protein
MAKLKIFSDRCFLVDGQKPVPMLYPFWGKPDELPDEPSKGRYDKYTGTGKNFFEMVSLDDAEVAVLPSAWEQVKNSEKALKMSREFIDMARGRGKKTIVFFNSDSTEDIALNDVIVFRTSFYRSRRKAREFAQPAWTEDMIAGYYDGVLPVRKKQKTPTVGFCGVATPPRVSVKTALNNLLTDRNNISRSKGNSLFGTGASLRYRLLDILSRDRNIETNFIVRDKFWGHAIPVDGKTVPDAAMKMRMEFIGNIIGSDYTICARGAGNFSYRLYETLCCGRIPVLLDTDCVLPFDFNTDWNEYCLIVKPDEIPAIGEKIRGYHDNISEDAFTEMQYRCRSFWEKKLSPEGFFSCFPEHLRYLENRR